MSEPRDTVPDVFGPSWEDVTPKVIVAAPDDPYLRGVMTALNEVYVYMQLPTSFEVVEPDGTRHQMSASEAARHLQAVRDRMGV